MLLTGNVNYPSCWQILFAGNVNYPSCSHGNTVYLVDDAYRILPYFKYIVTNVSNIISKMLIKPPILRPTLLEQY